MDSERTAIADWFHALSHDPALFVVIRPERLSSGGLAVKRLLASASNDERASLAGTTNDLAASRSRSDIWQLAPLLFDGGWPETIAGWDRTRPVLAALNAADHEVDLAMLFRTLMFDPGAVEARALHHRISIPAKDSGILLKALADLLKKRGIRSIAGGTSTSEVFVLPGSGLVALFAENLAVRVEMVTDEFPAERNEHRRVARWLDHLSRPPTPAANIEPFRELAGSGKDAVVVHARTRNFYRWQFQRWLGIAAQITTLASPIEKRSLLAKGATDVLTIYPWMSPQAGNASADAAMGLSLIGGVGLRMTSQTSRLGLTDTEKPRTARVEEKVPLALGGEAYLAAAASVGVDGMTKQALRADLERCGLPCSTWVLATDPVHSVVALKAVPGSRSAHMPVRVLAYPGGPSAGKTLGMERMVGISHAMHTVFDTLSGASPSPDGHPQPAWLQLEAALSFRDSDPSVARSVKAIHLAAALFEAERLNSALRHDEGAGLLADECRRGQPEACARKRTVTTTPAVHLPVVRTPCDFVLPGPGARVLALDQDGRISEITGGPPGEGLILEVAAGVRHGAVIDALRRLPNETVSFPATNANGIVTNLPVRLRSRDPDPPSSTMFVLGYRGGKTEATLDGPDGDRVPIKISVSCMQAPPCPLAVALKDRQTRASGVAPVVFLDIDDAALWNETLTVVANATCMDATGNANQAAVDMTLFASPALRTRLDKSKNRRR